MSVFPTILKLLVAAGLAAGLGAQDWPTYRADNSRSGISTTALTMPLAESWAWRSRHAPQPAWPGPAKRDAYNKVENLKKRHAFDEADDVAAHVLISAIAFGWHAQAAHGFG